MIETTERVLTREVAPRLVPGTETGSFCNPVIDQDFPDPAVLQVNGVYYAYGTQIRGTYVQVARSTDLVNWEMLPDALPELPDWAMPIRGCYTWSPVVARPAQGEHYVLYYVTRNKCGLKGTQAIGTAISDNPAGPFRPVGDAPFICQTDEGGTIDPHVFIEDDGTRYLLWKNDGNSCRLPTYIYMQRLSADGLSLEGERVRLLRNDQTWEGPLIEAPTLWKRGSKYYLFYSANCYANATYAVGYAVSDNLWGPYQKAEGPLLKTDKSIGLIGPGGQDIVFGPQGDTWLVYHAWTGLPESVAVHLAGRSKNCYRHMRISRLAWRNDRPVIEDASNERQPVP